MSKLVLKILAGGLALTALVLPEQASAHDNSVYGYRVIEKVDRRGYRDDYRAPRWVVRDHDFMRWYERSHHRHRHNVDWYRLFEIYLHEISDRKHRKYDRRHRYDYYSYDRYKGRHHDHRRRRH